MMATGIILAGGASKRMPGDKAFMEVSGRRVIDIQLEVMRGLFEEILVVGNADRMSRLRVYEKVAPRVRVVEEPVGGKGPLGGILSGLMLSGSEDNFIVACDMPFIRREAIEMVLRRLDGHQVAVPATPKGLEPLHAAYARSCAPLIESQLAAGDLKVTDFFEKVDVEYIPWEELLRFDPTGRLLMNINEPEDMRRAAGWMDGDDREGCDG
jgi:molybdopterin-guanine dinucleotide biosynthesis protein A